MSFTIPEFVIHKTVESLIQFVRDDYAANIADTTQSWLYKLCANVGIQRIDAFEQLVAIVCTEPDSPRELKVDLMFNLYHDKVPTITIMLPAEATNQQGNGLGQDQGYEDEIYNEGDADLAIPGDRMPVLTRSYTAVYDLLIDTDSPNEAILIYHFLKALLTAGVFHFHQHGIINVNISGQDVQSKQTTRELFKRAVRINLQYDTSTPVINKIPMPHSLGDVDGIPVNEL